MSEPRVADLMVQVALRLGADRRPVSPTALHRTYLKEFPQTRVGRSIEGFAATLGYHCINTRSRFPDPADKRRPADWQRRPLFKRVARGRYMLLSDAEIECFRRCLEQSLAIVYVDTCDVADLPCLGLQTHQAPDPGGTEAERRVSSVTRNGQKALPPSAALRDALRRFVRCFDDCEDTAFREEPGRPDLTLPVDVRGSAGSHLLLAAAIDVGVNSSHIRPFLVRLHANVPGGLFAISTANAALVDGTIAACQRAVSGTAVVAWGADGEVRTGVRPCRRRRGCNRSVWQLVRPSGQSWCARYPSARRLTSLDGRP